MTPRENYTIYLSIAFDLEPWNHLIHNNNLSKNNRKEKETIMVFGISFHESLQNLYTKDNQELFGYRKLDT